MRFCRFPNILLHISLKMGNKVKIRLWNSSLNLELSVLSFFLLSSLFCFEAQKYFFYSFQLFANGHIHNSTLINVLKLNSRNNNVVLTLSNVSNINNEIDNVHSTLFNVANFNVDLHNFASRLIWHYSTLWCHSNLITTLKQRWNRCW